MKGKSDKIAAIIQREVSSIIQMELKDPKVGFITITDVTVTNDLSIAKIYVTFLGKQARIDAGMKALERSTGARGLRAILESAMTKLMYEVPSRRDIAKVEVTPECIRKTGDCRYVYRKDLLEEQP